MFFHAKSIANPSSKFNWSGWHSAKDFKAKKNRGRSWHCGMDLHKKRSGDAARSCCPWMASWQDLGMSFTAFDEFSGHSNHIKAFKPGLDPFASVSSR